MNINKFNIKNVPGIYKITNMSSGKFYIGSSKIMHKRITRHFWELKKGVHTNSYLQRAFDKYGFNSFKVEVLELCNEQVLIEAEQFYMDFYEPRYNLIKFAGKTVRGKKLSDEQRQHLSFVNMGHIVSEETKMKISLRNKGRRKESTLKKKDKDIWKTSYSEDRRFKIAKSKANINDETIVLIRKLSVEGLTYKQISNITGVVHTNVGKIVRKETYKWID